MAAASAPRARVKRATSLRARVRDLWTVEAPVSDVEERKLAAEYAYSMGWHLPVDDQVLAMKRQTEGAPTLRRRLRPVH